MSILTQWSATMGDCSRCGKPYVYVGDWYEGQPPAWCTCPKNTYQPFPGSPPEIVAVAPVKDEEEFSLLDCLVSLSDMGYRITVTARPQNSKRFEIAISGVAMFVTNRPAKLLRKFLEAV